jgi:hypothetical protein
MTSEAAFTELDARLAQIEQTLDDALWALVQARSAEWSHAVIDHYETALDDMVGAIKQARDASRQLAAGPVEQFDSARARRALAICQKCFNQAWLHYYGDLVVYERKSALYQLRRRGREWASWVKGVDDALARCPQPLYEASRALLDCWQELSARGSAISVAAQATSLGAGWFNLDRDATDGRLHEQSIVAARADG